MQNEPKVTLYDGTTEEEMKEYLAGLEAKNKEKGREQKSLAEGTVEVEEVAILFDFIFSPETFGGEEKVVIIDPVTGEKSEVWIPVEESNQLRYDCRRLNSAIY